MKDFALYTDFDAITTDETFLNKQLLISTTTTEKDIDTIFEQCIKNTKDYSIFSEVDNYLYNARKLYYLSIYKYNLIRDDHRDPSAFEKAIAYCNSSNDKLLKEKENAMDILKYNCLIATLYTLDYFENHSSHISFINLAKRMHTDTRFLSTDREKAKRAFKNSSSASYLNEYIELLDDFQIPNFCSYMTAHLILSHQKSVQYYDGFTASQFDSVLLGLRENKIRDKYKHKEKQLKKISNFLTELYDIECNWHAPTDNLTDQLIYNYTKELIFHSKSILSCIDRYTQDSYEDWLAFYDRMCENTSFPITYHTEQLTSFCQYFTIVNEIPITLKHRLPIIYKTFFILFLNSRNKDHRVCEKHLVEYLNRYASELLHDSVTHHTDSSQVPNPATFINNILPEFDINELDYLCTVLYESVYRSKNYYSLHTKFKAKFNSDSLAIALDYISTLDKYYPINYIFHPNSPSVTDTSPELMYPTILGRFYHPELLDSH